MGPVVSIAGFLTAGQAWIFSTWRAFGAIEALWLAGALLAVCAILFRVARRVILRALPVTLIVALLGYAAYLALRPMIVPSAGNVPLMQALLAGGVIAAGWIVTFAVQELRAEQTRRATEIEILVALRAELFDYLADARRDDLREEGQAVVERILGGPTSEPYHPFIPTPKVPRVFDALAGQMHLLPDPPLAAVIAAHSQMGDVLSFGRDLQQDDFRALPSARRAAVYRDFVSMRIEAEALAREATDAINRALPLRRRVSAPGDRGT
jgi:hypothetical protein